MRNQQRHLAFGEFGEALEHFVLRSRVQRRGRLVQNQYLGIAQVRAGERDLLPLSARQINAALKSTAQNLFVALGKLADNLFG